ncbi:MAG: hypothetical protein QG625_4199 [Cyanobacteriota bacterium erpe_2018_sw_39hr_WHONDRS-SW48-000098_B_bin.30]|jgi:tetratricopeptide (TPR) repeat protein|nr:hypothetical protein [Cyanobacteriota bacterium erpe_2018_sw_39hr_WHONDRS-SW48-000098_B_bin.30]
MGVNSQVGNTKKKGRKARAHGNPGVLKGDKGGIDKPAFIDLAESGKGKGLLFPFSGQALVQLARGTAVVIACCLALPDAVALIPNATSLVSWAINLIKVWVIASVLWFVGFLYLVNLFRFISRGILITDKGIKVSRFDRVIPFECIHSVSLEPNRFFTKVFGLPETARRLTILFDLGFGGKIVKQFLFPNFVPSFFFDKPTFDALVLTLLERTELLPKSLKGVDSLATDFALCAVRTQNLPRVAGTWRFFNKQRIFVTVIIAISLVTFLGRKAVVNFAYNSGNRSYSYAHFDKARDFYQMAVRFDPTFAVAWNALGQTEFRLSEQNLTPFKVAERCWNNAILCKLDYVEPRLNIARLCFFRRDFKRAAELIEHAAKLAPTDNLVNLEQAELDLRRGRLDKALATSKKVLAQERITADHKLLAHCFIAQILLDKGQSDMAFAEIKDYPLDARLYTHGENFTMLCTTRARIDVVRGQYKEAQDLADIAVTRRPHEDEVLLQMVAVYIEIAAQNGPTAAACRKQADLLLERVSRHYTINPWLEIERARLVMLDDQKVQAVEHLEHALAVSDDKQDVVALDTAADMLRDLGAEKNKPLTAPILAKADSLYESATRRATKLRLEP